MNVYGRTIPTLGIGTVAVDLPYKKQGLAKQLLQHFLKEAVDKNCPLTHLYPFKPDFYRRMGFGFGPQLNVFHFAPAQLPFFKDAERAAALSDKDLPRVKDCYKRWAESTHGACHKQDYEFRFLKMEDTETIGVYLAGELEGYMSFQMKQAHGDSFLQHNLHVTNWCANSTEAFQALINFLHNQKDQVKNIVFPTFHDTFAFLLDDPRRTNHDLIFNIYHETHRRGTGVMYRIVDFPLFLNYLKDYSFSTDDLTIAFEVSDSFMDEKPSDYAVHFSGSGTQFVEGYEADASIKLDVAELSSLFMGCVTLEELLFLGKAEASGERVEAAKRVFSNPVKPENWSFI
ncbi:GNAT family N-acetyltransferase [Halobacillus salinarum]|uniref:GNAT family N-acetyltransferase n=1 Tax=Halobacillus salinarum TaxID=2932257 RepID=A0ABY4ENP8_9BACI|nr:GNAT family N-acetyltransferase [Halobacillus salinarum]UOQ45284.1 GNAT family N-acetyltransferase [Halobacillus salinarum]